MTDLCRADAGPCHGGPGVHGPTQAGAVSGDFSGLGLGGDLGNHLHQNDPALWPGALDDDYRAGARPVGAGRGAVSGRAAGLESGRRAGVGDCRDFVRGTGRRASGGQKGCCPCLRGGRWRLMVSRTLTAIRPDRL